MYTQGHLSPTWDINQFKQLNYKLDYHKNTELIDQYVSSGHTRESMHVYNCFEDQLVVNTSGIRKNFSWIDNIALAVNLFTPGQYLPLHRDSYQRYSSVFNIDQSQIIIRIILMLEDNCPGQILQINDTTIAQWVAGDWFGWSGDELHAFYNLSMSNRYAVQLSGTLC